MGFEGLVMGPACWHHIVLEKRGNVGAWRTDTAGRRRKRLKKDGEGGWREAWVREVCPRGLSKKREGGPCGMHVGDRVGQDDVFGLRVFTSGPRSSSRFCRERLEYLVLQNLGEDNVRWE
jgi:hypothetical protein